MQTNWFGLFLVAILISQHIGNAQCCQFHNARGWPARTASPTTFTAVSGRFLTGHALWQSMLPSTPTRCAVLCQTEPLCRSFGYLPREKRCVLHAETKEDFPEDFGVLAEALHYSLEPQAEVECRRIILTSYPDLGTTPRSLMPLTVPPGLKVCQTHDLEEDDILTLNEMFPQDSFRFDFEVKTAAGAAVRLGRMTGDDDPISVFTIVLGCNANSQTDILDTIAGTVLASAPSPDILSGKEFRQFWLSYQHGIMTVGRAWTASNGTVLVEYHAVDAPSGIRRVMLASHQALKTSKWHVLKEVCGGSDGDD